MKNQLGWVWELPDWPQWRWDSSALSPALARARRAQGEAIGRAKLLIPSLDARAHGEFLVQEGLNTSAIEGEQLDVSALRSSIARRLGLPSGQKSAAPAPRNVEGLVDVLQDATEKYLEPLTLEKINSWQAALFPTGAERRESQEAPAARRGTTGRSGLHEIHVGRLHSPEPMRIVSGPLNKERGHYEAPPRNGLDEQMPIFLRWFNKDSVGIDGLIRAGVAHLWFEVLHPYEDGNGRVGRAILDLALAQDEKRSTRVYSLSAQLYRVRDDYYATLERASRASLDATAWLEFFLIQVAEAAESSETAIGTVLDKARFWMAHGGQPLNERQRKAVNLMLDKGRGSFEGGMTNAKYARLTRASPATAQRDLAGLVNIGMLALTGAGRGARYEVHWEETPGD